VRLFRHCTIYLIPHDSFLNVATIQGLHRSSNFISLVKFYDNQSKFQLKGEKYKRPLANTHGEEIQDWYQRKSFYLCCDGMIDDILFSARLVDELISGFPILKPLYQYLLEVKNRWK